MSFADDRQRGAHLLRRFGLGASEAELNYYLTDGVGGAVDKLLDYSSVDEGFDVNIEVERGAQGRLPANGIAAWWALRMMMTRRPLQERMTLFWHDHFATSAGKVGQGLLMYTQNELLRTNALGTFRNLLSQVSKDPAMIFWLDNQLNVKGHANENFAREVMELFTLGIGHYTEADVKEGARAFTGWSLKRDRALGSAEFLFRPFQHDTGRKVYLGNSGEFNGDDVLNILCDQPRTADYITSKIWDWFVWPKPDHDTIKPFADRFRSSGLDIRGLLRDIMRSEQFYSPKAMRSIVKSPADFCLVTLRQLGVGVQLRDLIKAAPQGAPPAEFPRFPLQQSAMTVQAMKSMGMWLLYPPDVHGWDNGKAWISSQTMVTRISWAERLFGKGGTDMGPLRYDSFPLFQQDPTPDGVVHRLLTLFDGNLTPEHRALLVKQAQNTSGGKITQDNANATASAVCRLLFAAPEFQMA